MKDYHDLNLIQNSPDVSDYCVHRERTSSDKMGREKLEEAAAERERERPPWVKLARYNRKRSNLLLIKASPSSTAPPHTEGQVLPPLLSDNGPGHNKSAVTHTLFTLRNIKPDWFHNKMTKAHCKQHRPVGRHL